MPRRRKPERNRSSGDIDRSKLTAQSAGYGASLRLQRRQRTCVLLRRLNSGVLDNVSPFPDFSIDEAAEMLGRVADQRGALTGEFFPNGGIAHGLGRDPVQGGDDGG